MLRLATLKGVPPMSDMHPRQRSERHSGGLLARFVLGAGLMLLPGAGFLFVPVALLDAQAPPSAVRLSGTVKSNDGSTLTVVKADGTAVPVPVTPNASVLQLAPGVTDLKTAQPVKLSDIVAGDKVVTGKPGDIATASRVIVIKSSDIVARNQAEQADWQKRGAGGIVKAVDGPVITISSGAKTIKVDTTASTVFRRYAADSVKFQDARPSVLAQIHVGDQLSVRGNKSPDGASIAAEEVVTGSFANLSGVLTSVDAAAGTVSFKDLTTKKPVTVKITANSDLHKLPATMAARFTGAGGGARPAGGPPASGSGNGGAYGGSGSGAGGGPGAGRARAGADLSRMLSRLPSEPISDLKTGDAVMIVASPDTNGEGYTVITLLSGVEALLTAPAGAEPITLSPWNIGAPEGGGGMGGPGPQ
jgi:CxxC motif-containing protein